MSSKKDRLIGRINDLRESTIKKTVEKRLKEFKSLNSGTNKQWFSELCFCLLTANTSAELGMRIQEELGYEGFTDNASEEELAKKLKKAHYRFYNRRAHFIFLANKYRNNLKKELQKTGNKREWLVRNIKGLGFKEASHFLRNTGHLEYAILDKHILKLLKENNLIKEVPKTLNKDNYLRIEKILGNISKKLDINQGELDLYLWYMETDKILK